MGRETDHKAERITSKLTKKKLYPMIPYFTNAEKIDDRRSQLDGIDFKLTTPKLVYNADEKIAVTWINKGLHTYAYEVGSWQPSGFQLGWLFQHNKTEIYVCLYADTYNGMKLSDCKPRFGIGGFRNLYGILIWKWKLHWLLKEAGISYYQIACVAIDMWELYETDREKYKKKYPYDKYVFKDTNPIDGQYYTFSLRYTTYLPEQPINLLFERKLLEKYGSAFKIEHDWKNRETRYYGKIFGKEEYRWDGKVTDGVISLERYKKFAEMKLTQEDIWKLRQEICVGSLFLNDYENTFGIDRYVVSDLSDWFCELVDERAEELGKEYKDMFKTMDTPEEWYCVYQDFSFCVMGW